MCALKHQDPQFNTLNKWRTEPKNRKKKKIEVWIFCLFCEWMSVRTREKKLDDNKKANTINRVFIQLTPLIKPLAPNSLYQLDQISFI